MKNRPQSPTHFGDEPEKIDRTFYELTDRPEKGSRCDEIRRGYRKYRIGKHLIYYRMTERCHIEIVRVLHGSMDIEGRLNE
jgi:toxin ParE1/3/4